MGGQWGYQRFSSVGRANRHSVCECTWLEGLHRSWKGRVATFSWECEPQAVRCIWSPPPGMCWCLPSAPLTAQSSVSLFQQEVHLCFRNCALHFLPAAACFPCAAHRAAVSLPAGRWACLALCVCLCHGLSLVACRTSRCLSPIDSVSPLAAHFSSWAHHHWSDALPAPVR